MDDIRSKILELAELQREIMVTQKNQTDILKEHAKILKDQQDTLLRNTITVEEHKKYSINLDKKLSLLESEIEPIKSHVNKIQGVGLFIRWIVYTSGAVSAFYGLIKLMGL